MKWFDDIAEHVTRILARRVSRRSSLVKLGAILGGTILTPLLPVDRSSNVADAAQASGKEVGDPLSCDYWRYCAVDGFLCSCCGGSLTTCPPGSQASPLTWIGTCKNPADGKNYIISYNDCCGEGSCNRCACTRNEGENPNYHIKRNNDQDWCQGAISMAYHCSLAVVLGVATEPAN